MFKEVIRDMDMGGWGLVGLIAFLFAFILILIRVLLMSKSQRREAKNIPLDEETEFYPEDGTSAEERQ